MPCGTPRRIASGNCYYVSLNMIGQEAREQGAVHVDHLAEVVSGLIRVPFSGIAEGGQAIGYLGKMDVRQDLGI